MTDDYLESEAGSPRVSPEQAEYLRGLDGLPHAARGGDDASLMAEERAERWRLRYEEAMALADKWRLEYEATKDRLRRLVPTFEALYGLDSSPVTHLKRALDGQSL